MRVAPSFAVARTPTVRVLPRTCATLVAAAALFACASDPNDPKTWISKLESRKADARKEAIKKLREMKAAAAVPALVKLLKDRDLADEAAVALGDIGEKSAVQPLADAIDLSVGAGSDRVTRAVNAANAAIARALGQIGDPAAVPALVQLLKKTRENLVKVDALDALGRLRDPRALEPLMAVADDPDQPPLVNKKAVLALAELKDPKAIPIFARMLVYEKEGVSFLPEASWALFRLGADAVPPLLEILTDKDKAYHQWAEENGRAKAGIYAKAAIVLGDIGDARAAPALMEKLKYGEGDALALLVRRFAAEALARLGHKPAASAIAALMTEEEANIRMEYGRALALIGDRGVMPKLLAAAKSGPWDAREGTIVNITRLGDDRERKGLEELVKTERTQGEKICMKEGPIYKQGKEESEADHKARCKEAPEKRAKFIQEQMARIEAAAQCKDDSDCWIDRLKDADWKVRERAALALGALGDPRALKGLVALAKDDQLDARGAAYLAIEAIARNPAAKDALKEAAPLLDAQLKAEEGKTHTMVINETLRRVVWKLTSA